MKEKPGEKRREEEDDNINVDVHVDVGLHANVAFSQIPRHEAVSSTH